MCASDVRENFQTQWSAETSFGCCSEKAPVSACTTNIAVHPKWANELVGVSHRFLVVYSHFERRKVLKFRDFLRSLHKITKVVTGHMHSNVRS